MSTVVEAVPALKVAERINRIEVSATMAVVAEAEKLPRAGDRAFALRKTLDLIRAQAGPPDSAGTEVLVAACMTRTTCTSR